MPARRATSSMVSSCTGVVGSSSRPICTSCARRSSAERRSRRRLRRGGRSRPSRGARRRREQPLDRVGDQLRPLLGAACARSARRRAASASRQRLGHAGWLCRFGVSLSLSPTRISTGHAGQRLQLAALVVLAERRVERGERPHRRGVHDLGPGHAPSRRWRRRRRAARGPSSGAAGGSGGSSRRSRSSTRAPPMAAVTMPGRQLQLQPLGERLARGCEVAGRRRHEGHAAHPVAEQLGAGRGQAHDRHAAHRVAAEDDRAGRAPAGRAASPRSAPSWSIESSPTRRRTGPRWSGRARAGRSGSAAARRRRSAGRAGRRRRPRPPGPASSRGRGRAVTGASSAPSTVACSTARRPARADGGDAAAARSRGAHAATSEVRAGAAAGSADVVLAVEPAA